MRLFSTRILQDFLLSDISDAWSIPNGIPALYSMLSNNDGSSTLSLFYPTISSSSILSQSRSVIELLLAADVFSYYRLCLYCYRFLLSVPLLQLGCHSTCKGNFSPSSPKGTLCAVVKPRIRAVGLGFLGYFPSPTWIFSYHFS